MADISGFERVASAYDPTEISLAVALLEGHGFTVLTLGLTLRHTIPHNSFAFGPVPVLVLKGEADEARALLYSVQPGLVENQPESVGQSEKPAREGGGLWRCLVDAFSFILAGVSHPRDRLSVDGDKRPASRNSDR